MSSGVKENAGNITQTDYGYTGQRNLDESIGLMDYKARFYSPYINRFIQPDSIVPNPANPQSLNRFSYVYNNPIRFNDPTGHMCTDPEDLWSPGCDGANTVGEKPHGGGLGNLGSGNSNSSGGSGSSGGGGNGNSGSSGGTSNNSGCGYHHCPDSTIDLLDAYQLGWQNFGQAWDIYSNPNATTGQRTLASAYMGYWGGAHVCLVICTGVAAIEYLIPGAISCAMMLHCAGAVFYSGGKVAYQEATKYANSTGRYTINMTAPGRILDSLDKSKLLSSNTMDSLWEFASRRFAHGASGVVNSFINPTAYNPLRTYGRVELPILNSHPNVLQIIHNVIIP